MKLSRLLCLSASIALLPLGMAHAGRPLTVDDAGVNDVGAGHVEFWFARMPQNLDVWTVSPAYSPIKGFEISATLSRDQTDKQTTKTIQGKLQLTPTKEAGCNYAVSFGVGYINETVNKTPYVNGIGTCNSSLGAVHGNVGLSHSDGQKKQVNWGVAYEKVIGPVTAHIERYGQETMRPATQIGMRKEVIPGLQIDGTLGWYDGYAIYSIGMKKMF